MKAISRGVIGVMAGLLVPLLAACDAGVGRAESIEFVTVPKASEGGTATAEAITGKVTGVRAGQRLVLYAKSGQWWVQPLATAPFTEIRPDATWRATTHLGTEYAALLVDPGFQPMARMDALPAPGGGVAAVAVTPGRPSAAPPARTLQFSGYDWTVRQIPSDRGGGPADYSPDNAWTDDAGRLHLRISRKGDAWASAEITMRRSLGYGTYRFVVQDISHLDPAVVFGMFTWDELGSDQNHREMDIEISRWGEPVTENAQFVLQPYYVPANVARFSAPAGRLASALRWEDGRATFTTLRGGPDGAVAATHAFTSGVPQPGAETVRLNLYVYRFGRTTLRAESEVVVEKFDYLP